MADDTVRKVLFRRLPTISNERSEVQKGSKVRISELGLIIDPVTELLAGLCASIASSQKVEAVSDDADHAAINRASL
jgi:hypothetical protein